MLVAGLWLCAVLTALAAALVDLRWAVPAALVLALVPALVLAGCSSDIGTPSGSASPPPSRPVGTGCSGVLPRSGPGSVADLAKYPLATALSRNPALTTMSRVVGEADLSSGLDTAKDVTLFAPVNAAFARIPRNAFDQFLKDKDSASKIVQFHVVTQRVRPGDLADGSFTTLEKGQLTTSRSGRSYTVTTSANQTATVVCGNVQTANATIYLIDQVLTPSP